MFFKLRSYADVFDWVSFLHCRPLCTTMTDMSWLSHWTGEYLHHLGEAKKLLSQKICSGTWTTDNPRCCSRECSNKFNRMTGLWAPRHHPLQHADPNDIVLINSQWWRKKESPGREFKYGCSSPQMRVTQWMWERRQDDPRSKFFVVCSEECFDRVDKWLKLLSHPDRGLPGTVPFEHESDHINVILGVDKLVLSTDRLRGQDLSSSQAAGRADFEELQGEDSDDE